MRSSFADIHVPNTSWPQFMLSTIKKHGNKVALVDVATDRRYTYSEIYRHVHALGSAFRRLGFKKGEVLCIYSSNCIDFPIATLAATALGITVTLANPNYTQEELYGQLLDSGAHYLLAAEDVAQRAHSAGVQVGNIKGFFVFGKSQGFTSIRDLYSDDGSQFQLAQFDVGNDVLLLPYSSGTTGLPKGVMLTHANWLSTLMVTTCPEASFTSQPGNEVYLLFLPMYHIYAEMIVQISLYQGDTLTVMAKFDFKQYLNAIQKYKVTAIQIVPPIAVLLAKHSLALEYDLSSVKAAVSGAAPLSRETQDEVKKRTGIDIMQGFGMTETSGIATIPIFGSRDGNVGKLAPLTEAKVVNVETGAELGVNQDGEIWVRGPLIMKGYHNNQKATDGTINKDGWLMTGDIGHYDSNGQFFIVDRLKELIKYKGLQVAPAELEALLLTHPAVADVGVVGVPDAMSGELPRAYIVKKANVDVTEQDLMKFVEVHLSPHKRLRGGVRFVAEIPKSPSGKILRRFLLKLVEPAKSKL